MMTDRIDDPLDIRFEGPDLAPFRWGHPLHVACAGKHLGVIDDVVLSRDGSELRIGQLLPTNGESPFYFAYKKLVLLAAVAFFVQVAPGLRRIDVTLDQPVPGTHDGVELAAARAAVLRTIGCDAIAIEPDFRASHGGHYIVTATWLVTAANLALAHGALEAERARMLGTPMSGALSLFSFGRLVAAMRRLIARS